MTRPRTMLTALATALAIGLATTAALAYPPAVVAKCKSDYQRLCPGYKLDSDALNSCMRSKHRAISTPCINILVDYGYAPAVARRR